MGSVRILSILLDLFSLRKYPNVWVIYVFLVWPKLAFVWGHITVKFVVVSICTYARICISTYSVLLFTYAYVLYFYVPYLYITYMYVFINVHTYLYYINIGTYMYLGYMYIVRTYLHISLFAVYWYTGYYLYATSILT